MVGAEVATTKGDGGGAEIIITVAALRPLPEPGPKPGPNPRLAAGGRGVAGSCGVIATPPDDAVGA